MRCRRCQRAISGIGKQAVPPVIPAAIAFAGGIGGLCPLSLWQDPSNALPHWSPVGGWGFGLGSLALASVLAWIGLVRRKCPECGSSQMLDAMEEESAIASERFAVQKAAVAEARAEAQPGSSHDQEMADRLAAREKELRSTLEQELRTRLVRELEPQVEHDLRGRLEKEIRVTLGNELKGESDKARAQMQNEVRLQIEHAVRRELEQRLSPATAGSTTPAPTTTGKALTSSVTPRPATLLSTTTARAFTSSSAPRAVAGVDPPRAAVSTAAKEATPAPVRPSSARADGPAAISRATVKTTTPAASAVMKTAQPAVPHARVETAPLSLMPSAGRATIGSKASVVPVQASPFKAASSVVAPSSDHAAPGKDSGSKGPG